jgi:DNA repair protein RecO (recombination protein O)
VCGEAEPLVAFDTAEGGFLCTDHRRGVAVSTDAVELVQAVLGGRLGQALAASASPATAEVDALARHAIEHHLERRLRSVTVLE